MLRKRAIGGILAKGIPKRMKRATYELPPPNPTEE
jgi:hypothetical protein